MDKKVTFSVDKQFNSNKITMALGKHVYLHAIVVVCYFLIITYFWWGVSGGDYALWIYFVVFAVIHIMVIIGLYLALTSKIKLFLQAFLGIVIGFFISYLIFKGIDYYITATFKPTF